MNNPKVNNENGFNYFFLGERIVTISDEFSKDIEKLIKQYGSLKLIPNEETTEYYDMILDGNGIYQRNGIVKVCRINLLLLFIE
jgi:hypothetical protein